MAVKCDFEGYVTKNDLKCADGRIIRRNAFIEDNGKKVPLIWQHQHDEPSNVLGHALLENRDDGVYGYCWFNNSAAAQEAKEAVRHGDIDAFSIYARQLKHNKNEVVHGSIKEVSLVIAGANPGACIVNTSFAHADGSYIEADDEATIYTGLNFTSNLEDLSHADNDSENNKGGKTVEESKKNSGEKTIAEIIDTMNEEQKAAMNYIVGEALASAGGEKKSDDNIKHSDEGGNDMKTNVFESGYKTASEKAYADELRHGILSIMSSKNRGLSSIKSLKDELSAYMDAVNDELMHADDDEGDGSVTQTYGIENIDYLFPDARLVNNEPEFIKRDTSWVGDFMNNSKHSPFSRIKSIFADITADEARAKGYTKGNRKIEEVFTLLKRTTEPTTVYKKNKLDRDDVIDIVDLDVVRWMKTEMRMLLDEEIARAALLGDGRSSASDDKIDELKIRPIWTDDDLYTIKIRVEVPNNATDEERAALIIKAIRKGRKNYKGSGNPTFYTTEDDLTNMLLIEDGIGRDKYEDESDVAKAIRCKKIVTVPVMEGLTRTVTTSSGTETRTLVGIVINPTDYRFGADKGGNVALFDDFDIDYNQQKYLMESRCSGALTKPYSAMAIEVVTVAAG